MGVILGLRVEWDGWDGMGWDGMGWGGVGYKVLQRFVEVCT